MTRHLRSSWLALVVCGLCACSSDDIPANGGSEHASAIGERARVLTLEMSLSAADVGAVTHALRRWVEDEEGYVQEARTTEDAVSLVLRVPGERLPAFRLATRELGEVTSEHERVADVTDQRVDLDARLASARTEEERLRELMSERTATLTEVLAVEARLAEVRGHIEQLEGQRTSLARSIDYARVDLRVTRTPLAFWDAPGDALAAAAAWGVNAARAVIVGALAIVVALGPMGLLLALGVGASATGLRFVLRRRRAA